MAHRRICGRGQRPSKQIHNVKEPGHGGLSLPYPGAVRALFVCCALSSETGREFIEPHDDARMIIRQRGRCWISIHQTSKKRPNSTDMRYFSRLRRAGFLISTGPLRKLSRVDGSKGRRGASRGSPACSLEHGIVVQSRFNDRLTDTPMFSKLSVFHSENVHASVSF